MAELLLSIPPVVFRVCGHPVGIGGRMVGHPVEPYLHLQLVGTGDESFQVADAAISGVGLLVVGGCIRAVGCATRINGHQPDDVHTERLQLGKALLGSSKRAGLCERADVHFVNHLTAWLIIRCVVDVIHIVGGMRYAE